LSVPGRKRFRLAFRAWLAACALAPAPAFAPSAAAAGDLVILVRGFDSIAGSVHYAVYDRPETFPKYDGRIAKGQVPVKGDTVRIEVPALRPGSYAVAVFHDENGNGKFDQGLFGIPLEQYGFSNDARGFFAPPNFDSARVELGPEPRRITIMLSH